MQKSHKYENVKDVLYKGIWSNTNEIGERKKQRQKWGFTYQIFRTIVKLKQSDAGQNHTYQWWFRRLAIKHCIKNSIIEQVAFLDKKMVIKQIIIEQLDRALW